MVAPADVALHERPEQRLFCRVSRSTTAHACFYNPASVVHLSTSSQCSSESKETCLLRKNHQTQPGSGSCAGRSACRKWSNAPLVKPKSRSESRNNVDPLFVLRRRTRPHNSLSTYFACHSAQSLPPSRTLSYTDFPRQACAMQGECC